MQPALEAVEALLLIATLKRRAWLSDSGVGVGQGDLIESQTGCCV